MDLPRRQGIFAEAAGQGQAGKRKGGAGGEKTAGKSRGGSRLGRPRGDSNRENSLSRSRSRSAIPSRADTIRRSLSKVGVSGVAAPDAGGEAADGWTGAAGTAGWAGSAGASSGSEPSLSIVARVSLGYVALQLVNNPLREESSSMAITMGLGLSIGRKSDGAIRAKVDLRNLSAVNAVLPASDVVDLRERIAELPLTAYIIEPVDVALQALQQRSPLKAHFLLAGPKALPPPPLGQDIFDGAAAALGASSTGASGLPLGPGASGDSAAAGLGVAPSGVSAAPTAALTGASSGAAGSAAGAGRARYAKAEERTRVAVNVDTSPLRVKVSYSDYALVFKSLGALAMPPAAASAAPPSAGTAAASSSSPSAGTGGPVDGAAGSKAVVTNYGDLTVRLTMQQISLLLVNNASGLPLPFARIVLPKTVASVTAFEQCRTMVLSGTAKVDIHNGSLVVWEPLVEPMRFVARARQSITQESEITLSTEGNVEANITRGMVDGLMASLELLAAAQQRDAAELSARSPHGAAAGSGGVGGIHVVGGGSTSIERAASAGGLAWRGADASGSGGSGDRAAAAGTLDGEHSRSSKSGVHSLSPAFRHTPTALGSRARKGKSDGEEEEDSDESSEDEGTAASDVSPHPPSSSSVSASDASKAISRPASAASTVSTASAPASSAVVAAGARSSKSPGGGAASHAAQAAAAHHGSFSFYRLANLTDLPLHFSFGRMRPSRNSLFDGADAGAWASASVSAGLGRVGSVPGRSDSVAPLGVAGGRSDSIAGGRHAPASAVGAAAVAASFPVGGSQQDAQAQLTHELIRRAVEADTVLGLRDAARLISEQAKVDDIGGFLPGTAEAVAYRLLAAAELGGGQAAAEELFGAGASFTSHPGDRDSSAFSAVSQEVRPRHPLPPSLCFDAIFAPAFLATLTQAGGRRRRRSSVDGGRASTAATASAAAAAAAATNHAADVAVAGGVVTPAASDVSRLRRRWLFRWLVWRRVADAHVERLAAERSAFATGHHAAAHPHAHAGTAGAGVGAYLAQPPASPRGAEPVYAQAARRGLPPSMSGMGATSSSSLAVSAAGLALRTADAAAVMAASELAATAFDWTGYTLANALPAGASTALRIHSARALKELRQTAAGFQQLLQQLQQHQAGAVVPSGAPPSSHAARLAPGTGTTTSPATEPSSPLQSPRALGATPHSQRSGSAGESGASAAGGHSTAARMAAKGHVDKEAYESRLISIQLAGYFPIRNVSVDVLGSQTFSLIPRPRQLLAATLASAEPTDDAYPAAAAAAAGGGLLARMSGGVAGAATAGTDGGAVETPRQRLQQVLGAALANRPRPCTVMVEVSVIKGVKTVSVHSYRCVKVSRERESGRECLSVRLSLFLTVLSISPFPLFPSPSSPAEPD